jgi:hypothetical protein
MFCTIAYLVVDPNGFNLGFSSAKHCGITVLFAGRNALFIKDLLRKW